MVSDTALFCYYLVLIPSSFGASERLCFVNCGISCVFTYVFTIIEICHNRCQYDSALLT